MAKSQFFAMCARTMRQILVDLARTRHRQKRPGHGRRVSLEVVFVSESKSEELLALDDALKRLADIHPDEAMS